MPLPPFPDDLLKRTWLKKKNATAGETGIGEMLDKLAKEHGKINVAVFAELENATTNSELNRLGDACEAEFEKVEATAKKLREFARFASTKAVELGKKKLFPKDTAKLIGHLGHAADDFDNLLLKTAQDIRKAADKRLDVLIQQEMEQRRAQEPDDALASLLRRLPNLSPEQPLTFVIAVGKPSGLVLARTALNMGHRNNAKELRRGQGPLFEGTCHGEQGTCIFVLEKAPPPGLAKSIARAAAAQANARIRVKVRGPNSEINDENDSDDVADPTEMFRNRLTQVTPEFTELLKSSSLSDEKRRNLAQRFRTARERGEQGQHEEALQAIETVVQEARDLQKQEELSKFEQHFKSLIAETRKLTNTQPVLHEALSKRLHEALVHLKSRNQEALEAALNQVAKALAGVKQGVDPRLTEQRARWLRLSADFQQTLQMPGVDKRRMLEVQAALEQAFEQGDVARAIRELVNVEQLIEVGLRNSFQRESEAKRERENRQIHDVMSKNVTMVGQLTFQKDRAKFHRNDKALDIGEHFKEVLTALERCEGDKSTQNRVRLVEDCKRYLQRVDKMSKSDRNKTATHKKVQLIQGFLREARLAELTDQYSQMGEPPWTLDQETRAAEIQAAFLFEEGGIHEKDGVYTAKVLGNESGVNAAWWIRRREPGRKLPGEDENQGEEKDPSERLYIFKPGDAEDETLMGFPPGGGAPREVLAKTVSDHLGRFGLDPGVCPTTLAKISSSMLPDREGNTKGVDTRMGSMQKLAPNQGSLASHMEKDPNFRSRVDKTSYDKVAVLDLLAGSFDRHGKNLLVGEDPQTGVINLIPIDHGLSLPNKTTAQIHRQRFVGGQNSLVRDGFSNQRDQLLGEDVRRRLKMMNPESLTRSLQETNETMGRQHPETRGHVQDENLAVVRRNLEFLQRAADKMPVGDLYACLGMNFDMIHSARLEDLDQVIETLRQLHERRRKGVSEVKDVFGPYGDDHTPKLPWFKKLGWFLNWAPSDFEVWLAQNAHEAARILRGQIVNPEIQTYIDSLIAMVGGPQQVGNELQNKNYQEQIDALKRMLDRRTAATVPGQEDAQRNEVERLGGRAALAKCETVCGLKITEPRFQVEALRLLPLFEREGGLEEYLRLGGNQGSSMPNVMTRFMEMKAEQRAFNTVRRMTSEEINTRQQAELRRLAQECQQQIELLRKTPHITVSKDTLRTASQHLQQRELNRAQGVLQELSNQLKVRLNDERSALVTLNKRIEELRNLLTGAPESPAITDLRQQVEAFPNQMQTLIDDFKLHEVSPLLDRLHHDVSVAAEGDRSPYVVLEGQLTTVEQRLANYANTPIFAPLSQKIATARQRLADFNLGSGFEQDWIITPRNIMDAQDKCAALEQRLGPFPQNHPRYGEVQTKMTTLRTELVQGKVTSIASAREIERLLDSIGA